MMLKVIVIPVCGENPCSLLVGGLSYIQVDKHGISKINISV